MSATEVSACAIYAYNPTESDEISVRKGDIVTLLETYDDGWWLVKRGDASGLVPSNYMQVVDPSIESKEPEATVPAADNNKKRLKHTEQAVSKENNSRTGRKKTPSSDLIELKTLREEAEAKINALSMAIENEKHKHDEVPVGNGEQHRHQNHHHHRTKPESSSETALIVRQQQDVRSSSSSENLPVVGHKQAIPRPNLQQVSLDPSSLKFISDIITERINYEFSVRDGRLIDKVKTMISSQTAPNSSVVTRYGNDDNNLVGTPQRVRTFSTSSGPGAMSSVGNASLTKPGNHPSKIPVRVGVGFPKIPGASMQDGSTPNESITLNPRAPAAARLPQSSLPPRRPSSEKDAKLPQLGGRGVGKASSRDEMDTAGAPSPAVHHHSHVPSSIVEPVMDGIQYPQCRSKVYGPSYAVDAPDPLPGAKLALHHVYGYDGDVNRHGNSARGKNVLWADSRRVVYPAAAVVIVQEVAGDRRQGFFCGHSDDVTCLAVHPQRTVAASGQMGKDCCVLVWEIAKVKRGMSLNRTLMKLKPPPGIRGFCGVDFSGDGRFLLAVGLDDSRLLIVYDWKEGTIVATAKVGHSDVNQVRFNPHLFTPLGEPTTAQSNTSQKADLNCKSCYTLVSFGGKNIKFWTLKEFYTQDESGLESISTFKGRPLNRRKGDQNSSVKFTLEGNLGVLPNKNTTMPEITSMLIVNDNLDLSNDLSRGFIKSTPKSRIFFGSANGSIYLWQQLEDDQMRSSLDKVNNGGIAAAAPIMSWQPRGRLVSVITELHDAPIVDMDYVRVQPAEEEEVDSGAGSSGLVERIISSSTDGIVNVWLLNRHETASSLPLDHLGFLELNKEYARSVSWDATGYSAILGTAENSVLLLSYDEEIIDLPPGSKEDSIRPKIAIDVLTQSHNGKVRKLAVNPVIPSVIVSISSDKVVRVWDFKERVLLTCFALSEPATAVSFSPSGCEVVLGNERGELLVYTCSALRDLVASFPCAFTANDFVDAEWTVAFKRSMTAKSGPENSNNTPSKKKLATKKCEILEIKFSPVGDLVALGCKDNLIHLLSVLNSYKHTAVCRGHSSYIRNIDFSMDGTILQSSDATRELMHWEASSGRRLLNAAQFRDAVWSSCSSVYGWSVQGVFNNSEGVAAIDGDINCVDRSPDARWLVTGGSHTVHNAIKLFNYPCLTDAVPSFHGGHTSPVLDVKILRSADGTLEVATAGGNDSCMFQWRLLEYK